MCKSTPLNSPNSLCMLEAKPSARMNKFLMGVSNLVEKECRTTIFLNDMDISRLTV